ncbi:alpha-L-rhamnosidase C-terminal domain-containing protein [Pedobacter glucosidilyticus]|uniref:alpha-L-rhamnosidase-related protein n=1 Tax=Pedobacter glucosidilyticus TaxID=1122941 RepID=UPI0026EC7E8A|nr:alpha-L-rhamnosidase C-terminal domain-containing protein [Pedobacter glucosidilyticus]
MKRFIILGFVVLFNFSLLSAQPNTSSWIWNAEATEPNTWVSFRKEVDVKSIGQGGILNIAVDSKYWLWINGTLVVKEGGLKRGPTPKDTYYDEVDIKNYITTGKNTIAVLVWYWGINGSSHHSSGKPGFYMDGFVGDKQIHTNSTWKNIQVQSFQKSKIPIFNKQNILSEWEISYDANKAIANWYGIHFDDSEWKNAQELGKKGSAPWNNLLKREIPQWKNSVLTPYKNNLTFPLAILKDTVLRCFLPHNMQFYPHLEILSDKGKLIKIKMERDWKVNKYVTTDGLQSFEIPAWGNGEFVDYTIPAGVTILNLKYRETSYNTSIEGKFNSSSAGLNKLWDKSALTTLVNMRDNYMDCPDRERSQWTHDATSISEFANYTLSTSSALLTRKFLREFIDWKTPNGILWGAVPTGRFEGSYREFASSPLIGIGVGIYQYFMNTGDTTFIKESYPAVKNYLLQTWQLDPATGLVLHRGGWVKEQWGEGTHNWYDWGDPSQDWYLMENCWYYLALQKANYFAKISGNKNDTRAYETRIKSIEKHFDSYFWTGKHYQSKNFNDVDDRGNALAVYCGLATKDKFDKITEVLEKSLKASIYMEKYVLEALYQMGKSSSGYNRLMKRYDNEITSTYSTLPEHFGRIGNHGWSGAPALIAGKYITGVKPVEPGYTKFSITPQLGVLNYVSSVVPSKMGEIKVTIAKSTKSVSINVLIPHGTQAVIGIPKNEESIDFKNVSVNNLLVLQNKKTVIPLKGIKFINENERYYLFNAEEGEYHFLAN